MIRLAFRLLAVCVIYFGALASLSSAENRAIILQSTTSTQNSGLFDFLLPLFTKSTGIQVNVVAVGTGQALKNGRNGDGDLLLVHDRESEDKVVTEGYGISRQDVMYNDFVIVGPADDPAKISSQTDVLAALTTIAKTGSLFISRGDDSGTHKKERSLWKMAAIDVASRSGTWYREAGSGMGATLNIAAGTGAYTLSDRATWIAFRNKQDLKILSEGDPLLFNQYGIILINPKRFAHVKAKDAQTFIGWITGAEGQSKIASYRLDGQQLFYPNAR